eukprot:jgi/Chlat1/7864/Chrsp66S09175
MAYAQMLPRERTYIEEYLEGVGSLPADLQRHLSTMRELDERLDRLRHEMAELCSRCLQAPSQQSKTTPPEQLEQVAQLRAELEEHNSQCLRLAQEKIQLAQQAQALV